MTTQKERAAPARPGSGSGCDQLSGAISLDNTSPPRDQQDAVLVFLRGRRIGTVEGRAFGFDAILADQCSLGRFNSQHAAARAILAAAVQS